MTSTRFWYVLSLLLACPPNSDATSTLKDLRLKRRRRMQRATPTASTATPSSYSYGGQGSYGSYGASYGGGGNAMKNLFGNSYGGSGKSYSYGYSYSYGDDESHCQVDPTNASTKGFLCSDGLTCIQGPKSCDDTPDCPDHSDELGCDFTCLLQTGSITGFKCHDGSCANAGADGSRMCDGTSDCADGSDELGCGFECVLPHGRS